MKTVVNGETGAGSAQRVRVRREQAADLVQRRTVLIAAVPATLAKTLQTTLADPPLVAERNSFAVRDPDGQALLIADADIQATIGEKK